MLHLTSRIDVLSHQTTIHYISAICVCVCVCVCACVRACVSPSLHPFMSCYKHDAISSTYLPFSPTTRNASLASTSAVLSSYQN